MISMNCNYCLELFNTIWVSSFHLLTTPSHHSHDPLTGFDSLPLSCHLQRQRDAPWGNQGTFQDNLAREKILSAKNHWKIIEILLLKLLMHFSGGRAMPGAFIAGTRRRYDSHHGGFLDAFRLALFDTQINSIQCLNFAQNLFNSIFN